MLLSIPASFNKILFNKKLLIFLMVTLSLGSYAQNCTGNWLNIKGEISGVQIGDLDITGDKLTIEATINRTQPYDSNFHGGEIVSKHDSPSDANYLLRPNIAGIRTTNGYFSTANICGIELNKTYHLAMVYDGSFLKYYRNGFLMSQVECTGNLFVNDWITAIGTTGNLASPYPADFLGYINEVRIWNVARSQEDLRKYQNASLPSPSTQQGLLAYYTFEDLKNKQGNSTWDGALLSDASINEDNPTCTDFTIDSCGTVINPEPIVTVGFTMPDTVCVNMPVEIKNTTAGGTNFYWNFCTADINQTPVGQNLGNIGGMFSAPVFMDYVLVDNNYYGFLLNHNPGKLIRLNFGNSLLNTPTAVDLGNFGGIIPPSNGAEGIQVVQNEGKWYAIIVGGFIGTGNIPRVLKIDFGADITNLSPVATDWGNVGNLSQPIDLHIFKDNENWYGFTVNAENNTITRFNFTNSFDNTPTADNLGNIGGLAYPTGIYAINENGDWKVFIVNAGNNTRITGQFSLSRLDFGSSLLNIPTGINLGNPGNMLQHPRDLTIIRYCDEIVGFAVNGLIGSDNIVKMNFNNDLSSVPVITSLGKLGNLNFPHSISKIFRAGPDLYSFITNAANSTLTRLKFSGCTNSNISNSSDSTPPVITYSVPGIYNVNVMVDEGLPTQTSFCKSIVVVGSPEKTPITDTAFCAGDSILLTTNFLPGQHNWNTGSIDTSISVNSPGTYWVQNNYYGCSVRDSINVLKNELPVVSLGNDSSICSSTSIIINAGNTGSTYYWQDSSNQQTYTVNTSGIYSVTVTDANGCVAKDSVAINVNAAIELRLTNDTTICTGAGIDLVTNTNNIKTYSWVPPQGLSGTNISNPYANPVDTTLYFVNVTDSSGCTAVDSILVSVAPLPAVTTIADSAICTGTSVILTTTGSDSVVYSWAPSSSLSNANAQNPVATPFVNTQYIVTATNAPGCISKDSVSITLKALPAIAAFGDTTVCPGANAQLVAVSSGNNIFNWFPVTALSNANIVNPVASPADSTMYYVQVTANNSCVNIDSVLVAVVPKPAFAVQPNTASICTGDSILLTATGGNIFQWFPAASVANNASASTLVYPLQNTVYKVVITNNICGITDSVFATVNINARPNITVSKSNDVDCVLGQAKLLATGGVRYLWSPASSLNNVNISNPVASPSETTTYYLQATGASGCIIQDSLLVKVIKGEAENGYLLPSAFTPNGDAQNDCFGVKTWGFVTGLDVSIYNRWGNLIFHATNAGNCWDGTYKGEAQPPGAYIYQVRAKAICGDVYRKGTVVLIR